MPHFVGHDFADFGEGALLQQIIVQRDSRRAEESGDIGADAINWREASTSKTCVTGISFARASARIGR